VGISPRCDAARHWNPQPFEHLLSQEKRVATASALPSAVSQEELFSVALALLPWIKDGLL
jgi:hypothetical protein